MPGLYAAGDVVIGLDQISHAMGEGGVAATTIRNDLARAARAGRADEAVQLGEEFGVDDDPAVLQVGNARPNGISERLPPSRSISSRSPAPKFSTATTVPSGLPLASTQARPIRSA